MHFRQENHQPLSAGLLNAFGKPWMLLALPAKVRKNEKRRDILLFSPLGRKRTQIFPTNGLRMGQRINISLQLLFPPGVKGRVQKSLKVSFG